MKRYVPYMKNAAAHDLMAAELRRMGPNATPEQIRAAAARIADTVDNRYGQMVADNLFVRKIIADAMQPLMVSPSFNLGSGREFFGAAADAASTAARAKRGEPILTPRMVFPVALGVAVAVFGAIWQYLHTGEMPKDETDLFAPRNGTFDADGTPNRDMPASYYKDFFPWYRATEQFGWQGFLDKGFQIAGNKVGPLPRAGEQIAANKDWRGNMIADPDASFLTRTGQKAEYLGRAMLPISVTNYAEQRERGESRALESFAGIQPAPKEVGRSRAMNLMHHLLDAREGQAGPRSAHDQAISAARRQFMADYAAAGKSGERRIAAMRRGQAAGLTYRQMADAAQAESVSAPVALFKRLTADEAIQVWEAATPAEHAMLRMAMLQKLSSDMQQHGADKAMLSRVRSLPDLHFFGGK